MEPFAILVQWQVIDPDTVMAAHDSVPNYKGFTTSYGRKGFSIAYTAVISSYHLKPKCLIMDSESFINKSNGTRHITHEMELFIEELEATEGWREYEVVYPKGGGYKKFNPDNHRYIDPYKK